MRTGACFAAILATALALPARAQPAHANGGTRNGDALSPDEYVRLMRGATIVRPETLDKDDRRYVGGVTYALVDASSDELARALTDVNVYRAILPYTREARLVGEDAGDTLVELTQGNGVFNATFTVRLRREGSAVRFWLDRARPHEIEDAWGYFRWEPLAQVKPRTPRSLLTYGILVDVGPGVVRELFEGKIQSIVLTVPDRVRAWARRALRRP